MIDYKLILEKLEELEAKMVVIKQAIIELKRLEELGARLKKFGG